ncbi:LAFA_0B02366g1_1 [Lachancea sp. 'fantastica']|nr:LAFA_0B02366g1_1 [Lachancea sp. 'fantastica']
MQEQQLKYMSEHDAFRLMPSDHCSSPSPASSSSKSAKEETVFDLQYKSLIDEETVRMRTLQERLSSAQLARHSHKDFKGQDENEVAARSVFVGNLSHLVTAQQLQEIFKGSVSRVNRVDIQVDTKTQLSRGFAYVEFAQPKDVVEGIKLNGMVLLERALKVVPKRPQSGQILNRVGWRGHYPKRRRGLHQGHLRPFIRGSGRGFIRGRSRGRGKRYI